MSVICPLRKCRRKETMCLHDRMLPLVAAVIIAAGIYVLK